METEANNQANIREAIGEITLDRAQQLTNTIGQRAASGDRVAHSAGDPAPSLYHWTAFQTQCPFDELGRDGHPKRGNPNDLTIAVPDSWRRMFGGSVVEFHGGATIGQQLLRRSRIDKVVDKPHGTSPLKLCLVKHEYVDAATGAPELTETQTLIYIAPPAEDKEPSPDDTEPSTKPRPRRMKLDAPALRRISPTPVLLFRYSALTFNGHRIHYDLDYCQNVEGYSSLVVHGPLMATYLAQAIGTSLPMPAGMRLAKWDWRAFSPILLTDDFAVHGTFTADDTAQLYIINCTTGGVAIEAVATFVAE
jgi:3-methylfumaryl-CoA hydratase